MYIIFDKLNCAISCNKYPIACPIEHIISKPAHILVDRDETILVFDKWEIIYSETNNKLFTLSYINNNIRYYLHNSGCQDQVSVSTEIYYYYEYNNNKIFNHTFENNKNYYFTLNLQKFEFTNDNMENYDSYYDDYGQKWYTYYTINAQKQVICPYLLRDYYLSDANYSINSNENNCSICIKTDL